jgi:hypothetical protein
VPVGDARTDRVEDPGAPSVRQRLDLRPEDQVLLVRGAVDERDVSGVLRKRLEQPAQWADADAAGQQEHLSAGADSRVKPAVGSLDRDARTRPEVGQTPAGVAQVLHRDPQRGARRSRGYRVRVAAGPAGRAEEAPHEELAGGGGQTVQVATGHDDGDGPVALADDVDDPEPVGHGAVERDPDAPHEHGAGGRTPQRPPVEGRRRGGQELLAGPELVGQGESDAEVRIQVQEVPRLVPQPPAGLADARDRDEHEQRGAGDGQEDAGVVDNEVPDLGEQVGAGLDRVPHRHDDDVGGHEVDRPEPDQPVPAGERVLPVDPLDQRDPGHQQDLDEQEVRRDEPGEAADGRQPSAPAGEVRHVAAGDPEGDDDQHAGPGQDANSVAPPGGHVRPVCGGTAGGRGRWWRDGWPRPSGDCGHGRSSALVPGPRATALRARFPQPRPPGYAKPVGDRCSPPAAPDRTDLNAVVPTPPRGCHPPRSSRRPEPRVSDAASPRRGPPHRSPRRR